MTDGKDGEEEGAMASAATEDTALAHGTLADTHAAAWTNARAVLPSLGGLLTLLTNAPVFSVLGATGAAWALLQSTRVQAYRAERVRRLVEDVNDRVQSLGDEKVDQAYLASDGYRDLLFDAFDAAAAARDEAQLKLIVELLIGSLFRGGSVRHRSLEREYAATLKNLTHPQARLLRLLWRLYRDNPYHEIAFESRWRDIDISTKDATHEQWRRALLEFYNDQEPLPDGPELRRSEEHHLRIAPIASRLSSSGLLRRESQIYILTPFAVEMMAFLEAVTFDRDALNMRPLRDDGESIITVVELIR